MATPNLDAIASTTLKNYNKKFADNVSSHIPFFKYMTMKGAVKISGGETLLEELMYAEGNAGSYSETDTLTITKPEGLSAAEYSWKQVYGSVTITGTDQLRNSGPEKQQSLLEARFKQAEISMQNQIGAMLFGNGTGNSSKDVLGLAAIVATDPTTGILGSINRANYSFWRNKTRTSAGSFATNGLSYMGDMVRNCTRGMDKPSVIVCDSTTFGYLETVANGRAQFTNAKLADLGFQALKFEGIDVIFDSNCPTGRMYFLNTDYLKFKIHKDKNFAADKFIEPADQDMMVAKILFAGQLTCSNCSLQGVIDGFTT